jgi:hypothetical protein
MHHIFAHPLEAEVLESFLHDAHIHIGAWPRLEVFAAFLEWPHEHWRAHHLVVTESIRHDGAQTDQHVGQDRQRLAGVAADAIGEPTCALLTRVVELDHLLVELCVVCGSHVHNGGTFDRAALGALRLRSS